MEVFRDHTALPATNLDLGYSHKRSVELPVLYKPACCKSDSPDKIGGIPVGLYSSH